MKKILIPFVIVLAFVVYNTLFVVQEVRQAIVLQFGDPKKIITEPGLNFKIPFIQNVVYIDRRVLYLDTHQKKLLLQIKKD